jgi:hypothetical protein
MTHKKHPAPGGSDQAELRPDGEKRFEQAIDIAVKTAAIRKGAPPAKPSVIKDKRKP